MNRDSKRPGSPFRLGWLLGLLVLIGFLPVQSSAATPSSQPDIRRDSTVEAIEKVLPTVVNIGTETLVERRGPLDQLFRDFYGPYYKRQPAKAQYAIGSGVIIDEEGYILTNEHVVHQANRIWVKLHDGREFQADRIVFTTDTDIALLKIRSKPGDKFKAAKFAADDDILLGETVIALGNPFGLGGSVSKGILSSKNRRPPTAEGPLDVADWLQTDASINPGNSGGALINLRGDLIGISVAVAREAQGIGFAIPIKRVSEALSEIFTPEEIRQLWFGAKVHGGGHPLSVLDVAASSPAEKGGLKKGDQIVTVNGEIPRNFLEFSRMVAAGGDKKPVSLGVMRAGSRTDLAIQLVPEKTVFNSELIQKRLGATLIEVTPQIAQSLRLPEATGLIIKSVDRQGPASKVGLEPGMIVRGFDGHPIENTLSAAKFLNTRKPGDKVTLNVIFDRTQGNLVFRESGDVEVPVR